MSNRDALRRLSRKMPAPPEIEKMMDALRDEGDMTVAIMAGSFLEIELERLILSRFKRKDSNLNGQIFQNRGPLSDMHSKILLADAMGFITSPMADELHSLKVVRNAFAHSRTPLKFDNDLVTKEIESLKMIVAMKATASKEFPPMKWDNKTWYLMVTRLLLIVMDSIRKHGGTADAAIAEALAVDAQRRPRPASPEKGA